MQYRLQCGHTPLAFSRGVRSLFIGVLFPSPLCPCLGFSFEENGLSSSSSYRSTDQDTMSRRRERGCVASQRPLSTAMRGGRSGAPLVTAQPHSLPSIPTYLAEIPERSLPFSVVISWCSVCACIIFIPETFFLLIRPLDLRAYGDNTSAGPVATHRSIADYLVFLPSGASNHVQTILKFVLHGKGTGLTGPLLPKKPAS